MNLEQRSTSPECSIGVYATYRQEQRIAKEIRAIDGGVHWEYCGPDWIPKSMRNRLTLFSRVTEIYFRRQVTEAGLERSAGLERLKGLTNLVVLTFDTTKVTDSELEHLKGLTKLTNLYFFDTQVTDAGMEHLKGLTNLTELEFIRTQVTKSGRAMLRKALPNCDIKPDP